MITYLHDALPKSETTYCFGERNAHPLLSFEDISDYFKSACKQWTDQCGVKFTEVTGNADLKIYFGKVARDQDAAETKLGQTPAFIIFNKSLNFGSATQASWDLISKPQNFLEVALHELGHFLGLEHSTESDSIMAKVSHNQCYLTTEDIVAIRSLYKCTPQGVVDGSTVTLYNPSNYAVTAHLYTDDIFGNALPGRKIELAPKSCAAADPPTFVTNRSDPFFLKVYNKSGEFLVKGAVSGSYFEIHAETDGRPSVMYRGPNDAEGGYQGLSG